jgi:hypothetical protein
VWFQDRDVRGAGEEIALVRDGAARAFLRGLVAEGREKQKSKSFGGAD